jgi:hypothetical protein
MPALQHTLDPSRVNGARDDVADRALGSVSDRNETVAVAARRRRVFSEFIVAAADACQGASTTVADPSCQGLVGSVYRPSRGRVVALSNKMLGASGLHASKDGDGDGAWVGSKRAKS